MRRIAVLLALVLTGCQVVPPRVTVINADVRTVTPLVSRSNIVIRLEQ